MSLKIIFSSSYHCLLNPLERIPKITNEIAKTAALIIVVTMFVSNNTDSTKQIADKISIAAVRFMVIN
jgi:4-hydroxy-3-methylbut-2-enyl diphosphate reductase IspH